MTASDVRQVFKRWNATHSLFHVSIGDGREHDQERTFESTPEELELLKEIDRWRSRHRGEYMDYAQALGAFKALSWRGPDGLTVDEELEGFRQTLALYKRANQRPHPMWSELLALLKAMHWQKAAP